MQEAHVRILELDLHRLTSNAILLLLEECLLDCAGVFG